MKLDFWPFGKKQLPASADASSSSVAKPGDSAIESRTNVENRDYTAHKGNSNPQLKEDALYPFAQWTLKQASDAQVPRSDSNQSSRPLALSQLFGISDADFLDNKPASIDETSAPKAENTSVSNREGKQAAATCGDGDEASECESESSSIEDQDSERENTAIPTSSLYQSQGGYNWADSDDDDDFYCGPGTHEASPSSAKKYQKSVEYGSSTYSHNGYQDQHLGTASPTTQSSEPDRYDAGYEGPSRSLTSHRGVGRTSEWGFPTGERWEQIQEDFQLQITQLHNASAQDIAALRVFNESPTISSEEEDLHDREMRKVFVDLYPGLPSDGGTGTMHIIDWKTLLKPDPDIQGQFILDYVYPRLCDVIATMLFESHPPALDAFLNMSNTTVEWWHRPHYPAPGTFNIVIRRHQNKVIIGTYSDHVFRVCWSRFIRAKIAPNGRWSEYFAFNGPATSPKVNGEISWSEDAFECVNPKSDTQGGTTMECWKPNDAFFEGRHLALHLLQHTLGQGEWVSYRRKNTVHYVVNGKTSVLEERSVRRVLRQSRNWDDQTG